LLQVVQAYIHLFFCPPYILIPFFGIFYTSFSYWHSYFINLSFVFACIGACLVAIRGRKNISCYPGTLYFATARTMTQLLDILLVCTMQTLKQPSMTSTFYICSKYKNVGNNCGRTEGKR
jgi:hypothetical protein